MQSIVRNVRDISKDDLPVLEQVVGQTLRDDQRLIIQVDDVENGREGVATETRPTQTVGDWTSVYKGLNDAEVAALDTLIKTRANLTRDLPQSDG